MLPYPTPNMQSFTAGADLSAKQGYFVKLTSTEGQVDVCAAVTDKPIGVLMNAPESGEAADVAMIGGGAKVKAGGSITVGARVGTSATGTALAVDSVTGECVSAIALDGASSGDLVPVILVGPFPRKAAVVAALAGTLTGTVDGTLADVADIALSTSNTYTDAAVNGAVNAAIAEVNLQLKELQTKQAAILTSLKNAGVMASA